MMTFTNGPKDNIFKFCEFFRIAPALLRQASYGTIKIGVYHYMKRLFAESEKGKVNVFKF
jgi:hypothetical protein